MKLALAALVFIMLSIPARADEIYTYHGPSPADLSGSFTTAAPIPLGCNPCGFDLNATFTGILTFSFTDGLDTWTPANSALLGEVNLNLDGTFSVWNFHLTNFSDPAAFAYSITNLSAFYYEDYSPIGNSWTANQSSWEKPKGSWTIADPVATPEPATWLLLLTGLILFLPLLGSFAGRFIRFGMTGKP